MPSPVASHTASPSVETTFLCTTADPWCIQTCQPFVPRASSRDISSPSRLRAPAGSLPYPSPGGRQPVSMPAVTLSTNNPPPRSRSSSPPRPPVSPITPPLNPSRPSGDGFPPRQTYTHAQPDQAGITPRAPEPISFDSNPDVIALKSAISVLQIQKRRATEDIQTLSRAMDEAIEQPEAFVQHLAATQAQPRTRSSAARTDYGQAGSPGQHGDEDDEDEEMEDGDEQCQQGDKPSSKPRSWTSLPQPQSLVRTPPINWAQYAIVGDSLEKLHTEQISQPTQGTPAVFGANGTYEFKAGEGKQERYAGASRPYSPGKDKIERKSFKTRRD